MLASKLTLPMMMPWMRRPLGARFVMPLVSFP